MNPCNASLFNKYMTLCCHCDSVEVTMLHRIQSKQQYYNNTTIVMWGPQINVSTETTRGNTQPPHWLELRSKYISLGVMKPTNEWSLSAGPLWGIKKKAWRKVCRVQSIYDMWIFFLTNFKHLIYLKCLNDFGVCVCLPRKEIMGLQ